MPELPEVETIVRGLKPRIQGRVIKAMDVLEARSVLFDKALITEVIAEHKISSIKRRAKVMIWNIDSGYSLLFHLKMTGQIIYETQDSDHNNRFFAGHPTKSMLPKAKLPDTSTRAIFYFDDQSRVYFNDQRKFGWIKLMPTDEVAHDDFLMTVGPEHDSPEFNPIYFWSKTRNRITPIKAILLDQSVVAGVGNIYADEALHLAKIHPARKASSLSKAETAALYNAIIKVLSLGIDHGGTSFSHFLNAEGGVGGYIKHARVFRRQELPCPECHSVIVKTKVAGRGTHYCPVCQPVPRGFKP